jgi:Fe-S oxidoreductase
MCPSYMVTLEEKHSTRGRARMLFEMLHGGPLKDGWQSDEVEDALKLCLACKGCKSDCPVNVDMATYKAEFRSHYYRRRLRPRSAYSMGLIYWWARLASKAPGLANGAMQAPLLGTMAKALAGVAQARTMPAFARETFRDWFGKRGNGRAAGGRPVLLWPDTFNNFFRPETAIAATEVLERAGFDVRIPSRPLCCGRPLYDQGMLDTAKRLWRQTLRTLKDEIEAGTLIVGLEPACVAAFHDELPGLFPDDPLARRLKEQTVFFSDFMAERLDGLGDAAAGRKALVHIHCNHHAVIRDAGERRLLDALGLDYRVVPSGCCGMAGAFGFATETYDIAMAAGERALLPLVRETGDDTLVLTDGFSCREQIEQATGRKTLHVAELMNAALNR